MKEVLAVLFPYLVLLYLFDCVVRVPNGHLIFVSHLGRRFRLGKEGAHAVGLLPTGLAVSSHDLPLLFSAGGVHVPAAERHPDRPLRARDLRFLPWDAIASTESEGPLLLVNGSSAATLPSAAAAAGTAAAIREVSASPPGLRPAKAEALVAESFDLRSLRRVREKVRAPILCVSILSTLLFLSVYAILPLALFARPFRGSSPVPLLLAMALAYILAIAAAVAARRAIDPDDASGRARLVFLLVLLPPGAAHVLASLTRDLFARFDHLAVAAALLDGDDFRRLARKELARLAFVETGPDGGALGEAVRTRERAVRCLVAQAGLDAERLLAAPGKRSAESGRYCPACEAEYLEGAERCADCDIPLAGFDGSGVPAARDAVRGPVQESACAKS